jgi:hypothetical protein
MDVRETLVKLFGTVKLNLERSSEQLADTLLIELRKRGIAVVDSFDVIDPPDEHLRMMKKMRKLIDEAMSDKDCAARDLASLSRRAIEIQRDISTMEERIRQENHRSGRTKRTSESKTTSAGDDKFDPANV